MTEVTVAHWVKSQLILVIDSTAAFTTHCPRLPSDEDQIFFPVSF